MAALIAKSIDSAPFSEYLPRIELETVETMLQIMAASMLVIATFSVGSMVSAYASASSSATPRSFPLIVGDDLSQNALSSFVGAFIYSVVALIALKNGYYGQGGFSALFGLTSLVFAFVIYTFVRWVDGIARLGRIGSTIDKVEAATEQALERRKLNPMLGGKLLQSYDDSNQTIFADTIGYVQHIKMDVLQEYAEKSDCKIFVSSLPGTFAARGVPLARIDTENAAGVDVTLVRDAFVIGGERTFEDDPRFGLVVLAEIAGRALSPAVNDPGTAIDIVGTFVRLFDQWTRPIEEEDCRYERIYVPKISIAEMFDDAFTAIARDGAGSIEVAVRLQKALRALAATGNEDVAAAAQHHSRLALSRAERGLQLPQEIEAVRSAAICADQQHIATS